VHRRLIALIGVIVPRRLRADWRQEWEAELLFREQRLADWHHLGWRDRIDLTRRSTAAFWDALWLQHGVLSYGVTERTRKLGIRLALGPVLSISCASS
jgi:hypothetical protein